MVPVSLDAAKHQLHGQFPLRVQKTLIARTSASPEPMTDIDTHTVLLSGPGRLLWVNLYKKMPGAAKDDGERRWRGVIKESS